MKKLLTLLIAGFMLTFLSIEGLHAQKRKKKKKNQTVEVPTVSYNASLYNGLKWRNIGPFRGGRSTTVHGVTSDPLTYYFGSTGGGVWKTSNGGAEWRNISDGYFKTGSVGSIAVSEADPNIIYVGMGEAPIRGVMTSHGDGVYKSTDAGATWTHIGLAKTRHISKVYIHPTNPDLVYVAAQGSPYAPTQERGIYRTQDGGDTWEKVLFVNDISGPSDLSIDPNNPRVLYAAFWDHQRFPWKVRSGGAGSSIWKTSDGGDTWTKLGKGLPDLMGKIGVSVSANSQRVYAIIEAEKGGLYRSDNGGKSWRLINGDRVLHARSWYYMHVIADPQNPDKVVVLNAPFIQSIDGGKTFTRVPTPHGDNHALWINPQDPQIMINGNDGGGNISYNGGKSWSIQSNQPTAQFYRVNADNQFPYRVYGGQQDNSSVSIPNRNSSRGISNQEFNSVGGCESAYTAFDPDNPNLVYAGCYQGIITEYNAELDTEKDVMAYPFLGLGTNPAEVKYRFNWNAPIIVSSHDSKVIYHAGNKLLKSSDRGISWEEISPDLTRNEAEKIGWGGGPITNEGAGGEIYHTIYYVAESPQDAKTIWVGSDDGLVHITRDGGENWTPITPPSIGGAMINAIDVSTHTPGKAYLAVTKYKFNDFTPHIFRTNDYGKTWKRVVKGIAPEAHIRVVREDPARKGLLYAGTETGLYMSFDDGESWNNFQLNLPIVPITDLKVHHNDLVASTQGRAFWILDDLTPLHQLSDEIANSEAYFYQPRDPYLFGGPRIDSMSDRGTNPDFGAVLHYYVKSEDKPAVTVEIMDAQGEVLRTFSSDAKKKNEKAGNKVGMNKLVWDFSLSPYEGVKKVMVIGGLGSYRVGPGNYQAKISIDDYSETRNFTIKPDPREKATQAQYDEKSEYLSQVRKAVQELYQSVRDIRDVNNQLSSFKKRLGEDENEFQEIKESIDQLSEKLKEEEQSLIQEKQKTFQDVINFPNQLDAFLIHIQGQIAGSMPPVTNGQKQRANDLIEEWEKHQGNIQQLLGDDLNKINEMMKAADIPYIQTKTENVQP